MGLPLCEVWFESEPAGNGIDRFFEPHVDALIHANAWLVHGRDRDLVIDTGNGIAPIRPALDRLRDDPAKPLMALATHGHMDHAGGLFAFEDRAGHERDAAEIGAIRSLLWRRDVWPEVVQAMGDAGYPTPELLISAVPSPTFEPASFVSTGCSLTRVVAEGDVIDLGDRSFEVLHLPGHTPGSIGLWDEGTGTLFSGDAVYIGDPLIDQAPTSNIADYLVTMERLAQLPAAIVHAGHDWSFGREDLIARCRSYVERRGSGARS